MRLSNAAYVNQPLAIKYDYMAGGLYFEILIPLPHSRQITPVPCMGECEIFMH